MKTFFSIFKILKNCTSKRWKKIFFYYKKIIWKKITFLYFTIFPYTHIYRSCGWWFLPKWADNCWWGEIGQSSHNSMRNLKYAGYFLTHAAHYLTQLGQDKQTPQPNLPIIRITQFMNWVHEWGPLPNTCGPLPNPIGPR